MNVFIGSSEESIPIMDELALMIEAAGHVPMKWNEPGVFPPGESTIETICRLARRVGAAVLVFAGDDKVWYRGDPTVQPRDNVLVEYGLFVGTLGRTRAIVCASGDARIASDIAGLNIVKYAPTQKNACQAALKTWLGDIDGQPRSAVDRRSFVSSEDPQFIGVVQERLRTATRIVMIGMGLDILGNTSIVEDMIARCLAGHASADIYMANPFSPVIESRLIEEERGHRAPWVKKGGMIRRLEMLLSNWKTAGKPEHFAVHLFTNYPTFALIICDGTYFVYPYAYMTLGNVSPVLMFSRANDEDLDIIAFLEFHHQNVARDALEAAREYEARTTGLVAAQDLMPFAVYFVPPAESPLYRFGTDIIGFDVRTGRAGPAPWPEAATGAAAYGMHLTVCDSLYFMNEAEVQKAVIEARQVIQETEPFTIEVFRPRIGFPGRAVASLPVKDTTGRLTVLHGELVSRLYRRAVATDDTLNQTSTTRQVKGLERELLRRYGSPYVLGRYAPHLTLLRDLSNDEAERAELSTALAKIFDSAQVARSVLITKLAVMSRAPDVGRWMIREEIELGTHLPRW